MLHRPASPRPTRRERHPSTLAVTGISVERLEHLIEEIVRRAIDDSLAELEALAAGRYPSWVAEGRSDEVDTD